MAKVMEGSGPTADIVRTFNPYLHGARGLFALMIVVFHVINSGLPTFPVLATSWPAYLLRSTEYGVELFFAVSGIVIVGALRRARGPLIFALERATRIYPVLWFSLAVIVPATALTGFHGLRFPDLWVTIVNLLALPPLLPAPLLHPAAWSLSYEMAFYCFCALAWALRRRIGDWFWFIVAPLSILLLASHLRANFMVLGMAVATLLAWRPALARYAQAPGFCLLLFLLSWAAVCHMNGGDLGRVDLLDLVRSGAFPLAIGSLLLATVFFTGILAGSGWLALLLGSPGFQFLGTVSYSLYLWHPMSLAVVKFVIYQHHWDITLGPYTQLVFFLVCFPLSLFAAWASQQILEKRVTRWLRRRLEGERAASMTFRRSHATPQQQSD